MSRYTVSIVGAGNMGHGFAAHFAVEGQDAVLIDHRESNLEVARDRIRETVAFLNGEELATASPDEALDQIECTTDLSAGVSDAEVVIETVPEDTELKREVFSEIAEAAPDDAVLSTNTSSIPITEIAAGNPAEERIAGCHWWYPPYLMTPVEVIRGERSATSTIDRLRDFVEAVNRDPIVVERDIPGFVWNRVQRAVYRECLYIAEEGIASIDDINRAIRDGYAARTAAIGPFETIDIAGFEQILAGTERIQPTLCSDEEPSHLYEEYLNRGRGGIDDGAGFFEYDEPPSAITEARDRKIAAIHRMLGRFDRD